jgi:hypothetical protein
MKPTVKKTNSCFVLIVLLTAAAVCPARGNYDSTALSYGPVAYWPFIETTASPPLYVITNSSTLGSVLDGYGIDTNPVLTAAGDTGIPVSSGAPGIVGKCARFSNPGDIIGLCYSKIDVPWNAALNAAPPFTIEFWAMPNSISGNATGLCPLSNFDPTGQVSRAGWVFYVDTNGGWQFRLGNRNGYAGLLTASSSGNAATNAWQHMVATWDGTNASLYANGVLVGTTNVSVGDWVDNPQNALRIGGTPLEGNSGVSPDAQDTSNIGNRGYDGWMDEVAIYARILSMNTICAHYCAAYTNNAGYHAQILHDGPVAYYELEEPPFNVPQPGVCPTFANSGSLGGAANGTNEWGTLAAQPGPGYAGFNAADQAVFFDGENGLAQIEDSAGLHFTTNEDSEIPITMTAWIKPLEQDFYRDIIVHGFDTNFAETFLRIFPGGGYGNGNYYEVGSSDGVTYYDDAFFPIPSGDIGNWVFLAGTFDGTSWNLYRNGTLVASTPASPTDPGAIDVSGPWTLGARQINGWIQAGGGWVGDGELFSGSLAEPAIFTNALSAWEIMGLYYAADVPPTITTQIQPPPGPVYAGGSVSFNVFAEGNPVLGYQWYFDNVGLDGQTSTNLTLNNVKTASSGNYSVVVTNAYGAATSSVALVVLTGGAPQIAQQPIPVTRWMNYPFTISVTAGGAEPLFYYWQADGVFIPGATKASYTAIAPGTGSFSYSCVVSNQFGTTNSALVAVTSLAWPTAEYSALILEYYRPIAYYRLDELSGNIAYDYAGGINGQYFNVSLGQPGYSPYDPDPGIVVGPGPNSYMGNINGSAIDFAGTNAFSFLLWCNGNPAQTNGAALIAKGESNNGAGVANEQFCLNVGGVSGNSGVYSFFVRDPGLVPAEVDADRGPNGTWQAIAVTCDGTTIAIYVNGVMEGSTAAPSYGIESLTSPVSIGSERSGVAPTYDLNFAGSIDEVAIFDYALSQSQVFGLYAVPYTPPPQVIQITAMAVSDGTFSFSWSVTPGRICQVQYKTDLSQTGWLNLGAPITANNNATATVSDLMTNAQRFYRVLLLP